MYDIIIIGAGTAGLTAAIYGVRAGKSVLVLEAKTYGGQIINTPKIENYPGIKEISGFEYAKNLYEQAKGLGAEIRFEQVTAIEAAESGKLVKTTKDSYECRSVILATGAKNRPLSLPREQELIGAGVSYCATCDGMFFRGREVAVVGGGNTALEDAAFLANYCSKVYVIHRRSEFRGEEKLVQSLKQKENVEFVLNSKVTALNGTDSLEALILQNVETKEEQTIPVSGVFVAIGQMPQNETFAGMVELDAHGYVKAGENCHTNADGIFTAGRLPYQGSTSAGNSCCRWRSSGTCSMRVSESIVIFIGKSNKKCSFSVGKNAEISLFQKNTY